MSERKQKFIGVLVVVIALVAWSEYDKWSMSRPDDRDRCGSVCHSSEQACVFKVLPAHGSLAAVEGGGPSQARTQTVAQQKACEAEHEACQTQCDLDYGESRRR